MVNKRKKKLLSQLNQHYKATKKTQPNAVGEPVPDEVQIEVKPSTPEGGGEVTMTTTPSLPTPVPVERPLPAEPVLSKAEIERDKKIESLIDAILNMTDVMQQTKQSEDEAVEKERKEKKPQEAKDDKEKATLGGVLKEFFKGARDEFKESMSMRNVLQKAGMRSAAQGSGSLVDTLLTYREQKKLDAKDEQKGSLLPAVLGGTKDYLKNKIDDSQMLGKVRSLATNASEKLTPVKDFLKQSVQVPAPFSAVGSTIGMATDKLKAVRDFRFEDYARKEMTANPKSLVGSVAARLYPTAEQTPEPVVPGKPLKKESSKPKLAPSERSEEEIRNEHREGIREGMRDELLALNKSQLEELRKLVEASTISQEERLEAKVKAPPTIAVDKAKVEASKDEEKKGLLESLMDKIPGGKGLKGAAGKLLGGAARFALPAAAVAGSGLVGYSVGQKLNESVINPAMEKLTGTKGETLGTAIYGMVDKVKGVFGNSDADKIKESMEKAQAERKAAKLEAPKPYRQTQTATMKSSMNQIEELKAKSEAKPANVIDARTNVNNNQTTVNHIRPKLKHDDSTFNRLLNANFSH